MDDVYPTNPSAHHPKYLHAQLMQNTQQRHAQSQDPMIKLAQLFITFVLQIQCSVELQLMEQELISLKNAQLAKIKGLYITLINLAIKFHLYVRNKVIAIEPFALILNVLMVKNAHMIGRHVPMEFVKTHAYI